MQFQQDPYAAQAKQSRNFAIVGLVLLILAVILGVGLAGFAFKGQAGPEPATKAVAIPNPPVTQATAEPAPTTQATVEVPPEMPKDVEDWLKHLERIERKRKAMAVDQMAGLLTNLAMLSGVGATPGVVDSILDENDDAFEKTPADDIAQQAGAKRAEWRELIDEFESYPPPTECVPIRNSYSQALGETQAMVVEVLDAISQAGESPDKAVEALMGLRGKSHDRIDVGARQADSLVQEVCDKYRRRKWFSVAGDVGGGMGGILGGLGGLGGR